MTTWRTLSRLLPSRVSSRRQRAFSSSSSLVTPLFLSLLLRLSSSQSSTYSKFTGEVFSTDGASSEPTGSPAALWDTNQDRLTDFILWETTEDGDKIQIYESQSNLQSKHPMLEKRRDAAVTLPKGSSIVSAIPGDFDGDISLDLVIVTTPTTASMKAGDAFHLYVCWGSQNGQEKWKLDAPAQILKPDGSELALLRQPTVLDFDGNTVPDLLVQMKADNSIQRLLVENLGRPDGATPRRWALIEWSELTQLSYTLSPHSSAFVDINGDLLADLCLTMKDKDGKHNLVVALHNAFQKNSLIEEMPFKEIITIGLNSTSVGEFKDIGQMTFMDFNNDLRIDALIPTRLANGTTKLWLFDWAKNEFKDVSPDWKGFDLLEANDQIGAPQRIHMGDYDQDGFVDGLAVVKKGDARKVVLLHNQKTSSDPQASDHERRFEMVDDKTGQVNGGEGSVLEMASFFDAYDDGFLDILVVSSKDKIKRIDAFRNDLGIDATWIKAMVYTGFCGQLPGAGNVFPDCPTRTNNLALSLPVVGASFHMTTTRGDGKQQQVAAGLLTQLTHFSLQMPTTIFGLGRSPNFVDKIMVGLSPVLNHTSMDGYSKTFEQTIPNSAVVINPRPLNEPSQWRAFIYVTPSSAMLETGIVLSVVFALLAILVGLLHLKEKREDQKEKLVEMQRFHFDAM